MYSLVGIVISSLIFLGVVYARPKYGGFLILAALPMYLLRAEILGIPTTFLELMIYGWFAVTILTEVRNRSLRQSWHAVLDRLGEFQLPVLLFVLAGTIALFFADDLRLAAGAWKAWLIDPILFFGLVLRYYTARDALYLIRAGLVTLLLVAGWGLVELLGGFGMQIPGFLNAMYESPNMVALLLVPIWLLGFGLIIQRYVASGSIRQTVRGAFFEIIAVVLGLIAIVFTQSYGGLLALCAGIVVIIAVLPRDYMQLKKLFAVGVIAGALAAAGVLGVSGKAQRFFDTTTYNSWDTRQQIWHVSWELIQEHPIIGIGFGNFEQHYYDKAFELYSPPLEWEVPKAHNLYLNLWLEMGVLGLISFVVVCGLCIRRVARFMMGATKNSVLLVCVAASLAAVCVHGLLDTPYFKNDLSVVFWFVVALLLMLSTNRNPET